MNMVTTGFCDLNISIPPQHLNPSCLDRLASCKYFTIVFLAAKVSQLVVNYYSVLFLFNQENSQYGYENNWVQQDLHPAKLLSSEVHVDNRLNIGMKQAYNNIELEIKYDYVDNQLYRNEVGALLERYRTRDQPFQCK